MAVSGNSADTPIVVHIVPRSKFELLLFQAISWFVMPWILLILFFLITAENLTSNGVAMFIGTVAVLILVCVVMCDTAFCLLRGGDTASSILLEEEVMRLVRNDSVVREVRWREVTSVVWNWSRISVRDDAVTITINTGQVRRCEFEQASAMIGERLGNRFQLSESELSPPDYLGVSKGYFRFSMLVFLGLLAAVVGLLWDDGVRKLWCAATVLGVVSLYMLWKELRKQRHWRLPRH